MGFVHLHVHSQFSILDGTMSPEEIASIAAQLDMPAVGQTDTVNLYGAVAFYKACKNHGIRGILGAELHVQPEGRGFTDPHREEGGFQLVALVKNEEGYLNLCQLITRAIFEGVQYKPRVDFDDLKELGGGLILLTGGRKGVFRDWHKEQADGSGQKWFDRLAEIFDRDHLYLELQDLGLRGQMEANDRIRALSEATGYQAVVTNGVHYKEPEDAAVHEVLNAISQSASLDNEERIQSFTDQSWFKSESQIRELFPDDLEAIERTVEIANRCEYHFQFDTYHFPATTPPDVAEEGADEADTAANWAYFYRAFPPPEDFGVATQDGSVPAHVAASLISNTASTWFTVPRLFVQLMDGA